MEYTKFFNLKKPERTDKVLIQDLNDNAETIDTELNKKLNTNGGK